MDSIDGLSEKAMVISNIRRQYDKMIENIGEDRVKYHEAMRDCIEYIERHQQVLDIVGEGESDDSKYYSGLTEIVDMVAMERSSGFVGPNTPESEIAELTRVYDKCRKDTFRLTNISKQISGSLAEIYKLMVETTGKAAIGVDELKKIDNDLERIYKFEADKIREKFKMHPQIVELALKSGIYQLGINYDGVRLAEKEKLLRERFR